MSNSVALSHRVRWLSLIGLLLACVWAVFRVSPSLLATIEDDASLAAIWPFPDIAGGRAYLRTSPLGMILYQAIGAPSTFTFVLLYTLAGIVAIAALAWWTFAHTPAGDQWRSARFVVLSPVPAIMIINIGSYDPFTLLAIAFGFFAWTSRRRSLLVGAGVILGFQHFEQSVLLVVVWAMVYFALHAILPSRLRGLPNPLIALVGILLGKGLLSAVLLVLDVSPFDDRTEWLTPDLLILAITGSLNRGSLHLWASFAGLWLILIMTYLRIAQRPRILLVGATTIALVSGMTTLDNLRVFVIVASPIMLLLIVSMATDADLRQGRMRTASEVLMWVGVPYTLTANIIDNTYIFLQQVSSLWKSASP